MTDQVPFFRVHAFTEDLFGGNPAAVCPLQNWLPDDLMQAIARENDLPETAFYVETAPGRFDLRWFTPTVEVDLCGHATLASAFVVFSKTEFDGSRIRFDTRSGELFVTRREGRYWLDFPTLPGVPVDGVPEALVNGLGSVPQEVLKSTNYMAVFERQSQVVALTPDFPVLSELYPSGVIATAPGDDCDFVSRFFAPGHGIDEDPVTGSAHCTLTPYWASRLENRQLVARQVSERGGVLYCEARGDRTGIGGDAVLYQEGTLRV